MLCDYKTTSTPFPYPQAPSTVSTTSPKSTASARPPHPLYPHVHRIRHVCHVHRVRCIDCIDRDSVESRDDVLDLRAKKLWSCMQGIPVLGEFALILVDAYVLLVSACELAALQ